MMEYPSDWDNRRPRNTPGRDYFRERDAIEKLDLPIMDIKEEFESLFDHKYELFMQQRYDPKYDPKNIGKEQKFITKSTPEL